MQNKITKPSNNAKKTEQKSQPAKINKTVIQDYSKTQRIVNVSLLIIFILVAVWYVPAYNKNLLIKIQEFSLFVPAGFFFTSLMKVPGGFLSWAGTFFTQFFYYPWLGGSLLVLFTILAQYLTIRALKIPSRFYPLTFIISFALLLAVTQMGYVIFSIKLPGYAFVHVTGYILAVAAFWGYRKISSFLVRAVISGLFVPVFYPFLGFYALLASILFCIYELSEYVRSKRKYHFIPIGILLVSITLVPYLLAAYFYSQINFGQIYTAALPALPKAEMYCLMPYGVFIIAVLFFSLFLFRNSKKETRLSAIYAGIFFFALTLAGFVHYSYEDENFHTELAMDQAVFENKWEDVLKLAAKQKDEPTRRIVMITNLALQKLNRGGDEMFSFKNGGKDLKAPWQGHLLVMAGQQMYYQYGRTNFCYHWAVEDMVERGMRVDNLRYLVKCALIKGENKLAQKYNDILKKTLFHKSWALKYQQYIDNPRKMLENTEFQAIRPLTSFDDNLEGNNELLEMDLLNDFAEAATGTPEMLEIALQNSLILRNSGLFWPRFAAYLNMSKRIPRHYQEAALLFANYEKTVDISALNLDKKIVDRFNEFLQMTSQFYDTSNEANKKFFSPYSDTYWYYFFFMKGIKTS